MANILEKYGIKEVADITFYHINKESGKPDYPVLYIDTAKTSTVEQTAETADARGGKGNPKLISWDYGKEITVTLEDALFSAKSMAIMFGNGRPNAVGGTQPYIMKTEQVKFGTAISAGDVTKITNVQDAAGATDLKISGWDAYKVMNGYKYPKLHAKFYAADATDSTPVTEVVATQEYFVTYDLKMKNEQVIEISANSFPGTYYITGDTYARSFSSGEDEFFQFIIPKAKVTSENTITLEAEGDPSVFSMNLTVLRPDDGVMMKLVKYDLDDQSVATNVESEWIHNHKLGGN